MEKADLILKGDAIFNPAEDKPKSGFVAVSGNRILAVGEKEKAAAYTGNETKAYDLQDKLVMPGFHDSHVHLIFAGMYRVHANLMDAKSEREACGMLLDFENKHPGISGWVIGFGWSHVFWDHKQLPTRESLDRCFPDRPVFLMNSSAHSCWVNSKAMEIAGITRDTPDPFGGGFERDESGRPTGFLYEAGMGPVIKHALTFTRSQEKEYLKAFMKAAAPLGITSVNDVMPYFGINAGNIETYSELDRSGEMTVRINAAPDLLGDLDETVRLRETVASEKLRVPFVKQFLDGVSTAHTALMLEDYADAAGNRGVPLFDLAAIEKAVREAHKRGLSVKLHACGDASARLAMDYYETAIRLYGKNKCRHAVEHLELVSDADIPRVKELGIIPSMQPEHIALTQTFGSNPYLVTMGPERASRTWPLKTMLDMAGVIAIGSDCPVVDNNPFLAIFRAVTRVHNDGEPKGGWNPAEKLTMAEVLRGYTYGSAYGAGREDDLGALAPGKLADLAVIDRNLFALEDPWDILKARVCMTIMDGRVIFQRFPNDVETDSGNIAVVDKCRHGE